MAQATEVYICREGQALKEGKLEYSDSIYGREDAEDDAKYRCRSDNSIQKIAYYSLNVSGDFRHFFTYHNPDFKPTGKGAKKTPGKPPARKKKKKPKKKKTSFFARLFSVFSRS